MKKLLAILSVLSVLVGVCVMSASAENVGADDAVHGAGSVATVVNGITTTSYATLEQAIDNVDAGYVILEQDVETLETSEDIIVDLNGKHVVDAVANNGATLRLKDSATADHDISDNIYGVVENISGNVVAMGNYLAITDDDGTSYHHYSAKLTSVTLSTDRVGIYYKSEFLGDTMVKDAVDTFGVALNVSEAPNQSNMKPNTYSVFSGEEFGGECPGTILRNIMRTESVVATNTANANKKVYGRPYIKLKNNGGILFGNTAAYCLKELTELVSENEWEKLNDTQMSGLVEIYRQYNIVMSQWDVANIKSAYQNVLEQKQAEEDATLKVIILGSSYSIDSYHLLGEVINAEGIPADAVANGTPIKNVEIGIMYKSGCYMYQHADYAKKDTAAYTYYKTSYRSDAAYTSGWSERKSTTLEEALTDEKWDIVVLQESNMDKGIANDYHTGDTQYVVNYVKRTLGYTPKFMWNMTWSNPEVPTCDGVAGEDEWIYEIANPGAESWERRMREYFDNDAQTQHNKIAYNVKKYVAGNYGVSESNIVTPGTTVMYALNNLTMSGSEYDYRQNERFMYRDYTHLSDKGRVMVSYLWYAELFGLKDIDQMNYTEIPYVMQQVKTSDKAPMVISANEQTCILDAVNATLADRFCAYTGTNP